MAGDEHGLEALHAKVDRLTKLVRRALKHGLRVHQGMDWLMDPAPRKLQPAKPFPPLPPAEAGKDAKLIKHRPGCYAAGQRAFKDGAPESDNPYVTNHGGAQRVWHLGWLDAKAGVDRGRPPRS